MKRRSSMYGHILTCSRLIAILAKIRETIAVIIYNEFVTRPNSCSDTPQGVLFNGHLQRLVYSNKQIPFFPFIDVVKLRSIETMKSSVPATLIVSIISCFIDSSSKKTGTVESQLHMFSQLENDYINCNFVMPHSQ